MRSALLVAMLLLAASAAQAADLQVVKSISCHTLRKNIQWYGEANVIRWALVNGYTRKQIKLIRRHCRKH